MHYHSLTQQKGFTHLKTLYRGTKHTIITVVYPSVYCVTDSVFVFTYILNAIMTQTPNSRAKEGNEEPTPTAIAINWQEALKLITQ